MNLWLQAAVGLSFGALVLVSVWRFSRSRWSWMTVREALDELGIAREQPSCAHCGQPAVYAQPHEIWCVKCGKYFDGTPF